MSDLRLKCTKFNFAWGLAPDHAREAYSAALPRPTAKGKERMEKGKGGEREGRGGKGREVREGEFCLHHSKFLDPTL